jgi:hypothetical protein
MCRTFADILEDVPMPSPGFINVILDAKSSVTLDEVRVSPTIPADDIAVSAP